MNDKKIDYFLEKNKEKSFDFLSLIAITITVIGMAVVFVLTSGETNGSASLKKTFTDPFFWVLFFMTLTVSITVAFTNYSSAKEKEKNNEYFKSVLRAYIDAKNAVEQDLQYLGEFCMDKNKEIFICTQKGICLEAGVEYDDYIAKRIDLTKLEKWQRKRLKALEHIKITHLTTKDLLAETKFGTNSKIVFLPKSEGASDKKFVSKTAIKKVVSTMLGVLTVAISFSQKKWIAGVVSAFNILVGAIMSTIKGHHYVKTSLADRFNIKTDLLKEYYGVRDKYVVVKEMAKALQKNAQEPLQEEIKSNLIEVSQEIKEEPQGQNMKLQNDNELGKIEKVDKVMNDGTIDIANSKEK